MWTKVTKVIPKVYQSPNNYAFEKMNRQSQSQGKVNLICDGNPIKQIKSYEEGQNNHSPFQFDVNLYFGNSKSSFIPIHPIDNYYYTHQPKEVGQQVPICIIFKTSLEKSGYKLSPEQTVLYKDDYKRCNSINSFYDDLNCYMPSRNDYAMNNNNNIINNIYPTFTKVTNFQILSDNDNNNNSSSENSIENKKENINHNNIMKKESLEKKVTDSISNDTKSNNYKKIIFECSGTNGNNNAGIVKNLLKKKRLRKNNKQLELLSKFYSENKIWSKKQIKEISEHIGLKENKIYKWLWDQKNKEFKVAKFVVNKNKEGLD